MDADLTNYIKATYPSVKCAVATCWEEGPKAYHTCNNSWYTLFDSGPWAPCKYYGQLKKDKTKLKCK